MIRTNNPALRADVFAPVQTWGGGAIAPAERSKVMTLQGAVNATGILVALTAAVAIASWAWLEPQLQKGVLTGPATGLLAFGGIGGFILALVITFKPRMAPILAPVYAILEGAFVGGVSLIYETYFANGIVIQAVLLTFGILASLLIAYKTRLIKATENFKLGVAAATGGILILMLGSLLLGMFGVRIPYIWEGGPIGIGVAGFIVVIAALNLVLDFDFIENGAKAGLPRHMEWYAGFGLLVTLVWLYLSILRLLSLINGRD